MSYKENYQRMICCNKATGYAIYHCLLLAYDRHCRETALSGITDRDITAISEILLVSERWIRHVIRKYHLFYLILEEYFPEPGWEAMEKVI